MVPGVFEYYDTVYSALVNLSSCFGLNGQESLGFYRLLLGHEFE